MLQFEATFKSVVNRHAAVTIKYGNSMVDNEGHCWMKQKELLLMEASSTQKATCESKMVNFNAIKKSAACITKM